MITEDLHKVWALADRDSWSQPQGKARVLNATAAYTQKGNVKVYCCPFQHFA